MRFLLLSTLVPVTIAACGGISADPPGADDGDASPGAPETAGSNSNSNSSSSSSGGPVLDSGGPVLDGSHPHDASGVDAKVYGACPSTCTDEPTGVPPCIAPERSCNCPASVPAPAGCSSVSGLPTVYCCGS